MSAFQVFPRKKWICRGLTTGVYPLKIYSYINRHCLLARFINKSFLQEFVGNIKCVGTYNKKRC